MMNKENLSKRVLTSITLVALIVVCVFSLPQWAWGILILIPVVISILEYSKLYRLGNSSKIMLVSSVVALCLAPFMNLVMFGASVDKYALPLSFTSAFLWLFIVPLAIRYRVEVRSLPAIQAIGILLFVPAWYVAVALHSQPLFLLFVFTSIWMFDIGGYFFGQWLGRHKMFPYISPGKTYEGAIFGLVLVGAYFLAAWWFLPITKTITSVLLLLFVLCAFSVLCILGDLYESHIKRARGVKDSGRLLPGHGGLLDRIDSTLCVLPFSYLAANMIFG